jgi:glycosyltransferase involved in cell wall biosynthesis
MKVKIYSHDIFLGDAVGNHCFELASLLRGLGFDVKIYAHNFIQDSNKIMPIESIFEEVSEGDLLIVEYSIYDPFLDNLLLLDCNKICYFHGITTPELLREFDPETASLCDAAYRQIELLKKFDKVISSSNHNTKILRKFMLNESISIIPPVFETMPIFQSQVDSSQNHPNLIMVGRVVPHKSIECGIELLALLNQKFGKVFMSIIGPIPNKEYFEFLINKARALGVLNVLEFKGAVENQDLFDFYRGSSGLVVMSRHEGFCVPVLESLYFGKSLFVRGGTAAEELCDPEEVFEHVLDLERWVDVIGKTLLSGGALGSILSAEKHFRAKEILRRCGESSWGSILKSFIDKNNIT